VEWWFVSGAPQKPSLALQQMAILPDLDGLPRNFSPSFAEGLTLNGHFGRVVQNV
jgi:hypothetical protein